MRLIQPSTKLYLVLGSQKKRGRRRKEKREKGTQTYQIFNSTLQNDGTFLIWRRHTIIRMYIEYYSTLFFFSLFLNMPILEVIDDNDVQSPFLLNSQKHSQKNFEELTKEEQDALLDQIASQVANDPKAFDRLAKEFLNQVKRDDFNTVTIHPQAGYVCKTHVISSSEEHKKDTPVYINICHASAIPAPPVMNENEIQKALNAEPETTYRVPLSMGQLRRGEKGRAICINEGYSLSQRCKLDAIIMDACINTQPYLRSEKDLDFRLYILELSMEYVEEILGVGLSREFTMPNIKSKGDIPGRVLRLPKPSLVSAIRTEMKQDHNENGWKLSYDLKAEESKQYVTVSIPMPDKVILHA